MRLLRLRRRSLVRPGQSGSPGEVAEPVGLDPNPSRLLVSLCATELNLFYTRDSLSGLVPPSSVCKRNGSVLSSRYTSKSCWGSGRVPYKRRKGPGADSPLPLARVRWGSPDLASRLGPRLPQLQGGSVVVFGCSKGHRLTSGCLQRTGILYRPPCCTSYKSGVGNFHQRERLLHRTSVLGKRFLRPSLQVG